MHGFKFEHKNTRGPQTKRCRSQLDNPINVFPLTSQEHYFLMFMVSKLDSKSFLHNLGSGMYFSSFVCTAGLS